MPVKPWPTPWSRITSDLIAPCSLPPVEENKMLDENFMRRMYELDECSVATGFGSILPQSTSLSAFHLYNDDDNMPIPDSVAFAAMKWTLQEWCIKMDPDAELWRKDLLDWAAVILLDYVFEDQRPNGQRTFRAQEISIREASAIDAILKHPIRAS